MGESGALAYMARSLIIYVRYYFNSWFTLSVALSISG